MSIGREQLLFKHLALQASSSKGIDLYLVDSANRGIWVNNQGYEQPISSLTLGHLHNIKRMIIERRAMNRLPFLPMINAEIERRTKARGGN
jgi:hypothetical protein